MIIATLRYRYPFFTGHEYINEKFDTIFKYSTEGLYVLFFIAFLYYLFRYCGRSGFAREYLVSFIIGLIFGLGVLISGLFRISKVLGFLTVTSHWDPTLLFVLMPAVFINSITFNLMKKCSPIFTSDVKLPKRTHIDGKLAFGAMIFGLGWGLSGLTPGLSMVNFFVLPNVVFFVLSMAIGQACVNAYDKRHKSGGMMEEALLFM